MGIFNIFKKSESKDKKPIKKKKSAMKVFQDTANVELKSRKVRERLLLQEDSSVELATEFIATVRKNKNLKFKEREKFLPILNLSVEKRYYKKISNHSHRYAWECSVAFWIVLALVGNTL